MTDGLRADVEALAAIGRGSASAGERTSAEWVATRLREAGAAGVEVLTYRGPTTYSWAFGLHVLLGVLGVLGRRPLLGVAAAVSLDLEASGRRRWTRRLVPRRTGASTVGRLAAGGEPQRTLVLVAHHDAARTGFQWSPRLSAPLSGRRLRRHAFDAFLGPTGLALVLGALPGLRRLGLALLGLSGAALVDGARPRVVPGANDNASGVAAVLALVERWRRDPLPGTEVLVWIPGGEESGMHGMADLLDRFVLDRTTTLVLGLDTIGSGRPIVARAENGLRPWPYAEEDLALVPDEVERWTLGAWTDPLLARHAGLRALSILSIDEGGGFSEYHLPSDTPDRVDFGSVAACAEVAAEVAARFSDR